MINIMKTEILKDENEDSLRDEVNEFIKDKQDVELTWKFAYFEGHTHFICFIEYREVQGLN